MLRQALAQGADDVVNQVRLFEQDRAAFVFVDRRRRAAEVEVDFVRAETHGFQSIDGHVFRIAAQKLDSTGRAGRRAVGMGDFGNIFKPSGA